jgi:hypothetical protein
LIGGKDPGLILKARRLKAYEIADYDFLADFITAKTFNSLVTTTHILTEASNLLGAEKDHVRIAGREAMKEYVKQCHEQTDPAALLVDEPEYQ